MEISFRMEKGYSDLKKKDRKINKNCRFFSFLPFFGKILERLIFEETFPFFIKDKLITANQSGFKLGDPA